MEKLIVVLIAAYIIAEFVLQTNRLTREKGSYPWLSILLHAAITYVVLQAWKCWQSPAFIIVAHSVIYLAMRGRTTDTARRVESSTKFFVVDQACHIFPLFILGWLLKASSVVPSFEGIGYKPIIAAAGFIATVHTAGIFIGKFTKKLTDANNLTLEGLLNGGKLIGQLERALIFLFIFIDQPAGIGFLAAAKSILRFEESKEQKLAEYVIIGTLLSFSLAVALASIAKWALKF